MTSRTTSFSCPCLSTGALFALVAVQGMASCFFHPQDPAATAGGSTSAPGTTVDTNTNSGLTLETSSSSVTADVPTTSEVGASTSSTGDFTTDQGTTIQGGSTTGNARSSTGDSGSSMSGESTIEPQFECGNGMHEPGEECDDGNLLPGDECSALCEWTKIVDLAPNDYNTCVRFASGRVRCWGASGLSGTGPGIGDDPGEMPAPYVDLGGAVSQLGMGTVHACAVRASDESDILCWGHGGHGALGSGGTDWIGDDPGELPPPTVDVGGFNDVLQIAGGVFNTCALFFGGAIKCWGFNNWGQLGYGHTNNLGDEPGELPVPEIDISEDAVAIAAGGLHVCAIFQLGKVRCWGNNQYGQLGLDNTTIIGDTEPPSAVVKIDTPVVEVAIGYTHTCARLIDGKIACFGYNASGQLGLGHTSNVGDEPGEMQQTVVELGSPALQITAGSDHSCALLAAGNVKCWGNNEYGNLGYGHTINIGDNDGEMPPPDVKLGKKAVKIASAIFGEHTCALLEDNTLRCWGDNSLGQLGYGHDSNIGDNNGETPESAGPVPF